jgi:hypothetical protein
MGTSFTELKLFPHEIFFVISTHISTLRETLHACRVKLFAEASQFFAHAVFQLVVVVVYKTASSECILQGTRNMEVGGC